jgi:hypothetical protein
MIKHIFLVLVILLSYFLWDQRPIKHGIGITAPEAPTLVKINRHQGFGVDHYNLVPTWKIETTARVLANKKYWFDDKTNLAPFDFVLGWNQLSDERILNQVKTPIKNRDFSIDVIRPPLTLHEIRQQILFMHAIPANEQVSEQLNSIRVGHIVTMRGYIVDINDRSSLIWRSSYNERNHRLDNSQIVFIEHVELL